MSLLRAGAIYGVIKGQSAAVPSLLSPVLTRSGNRSTYIPLSQKCRFANPGEAARDHQMQSGSCLGQDDIVRFEDS